MDYLDEADSIALIHPGSSDTAAVRFLYDLSTDRPTDPFCNDSALSLDTDCNVNDKGDPYGSHGPNTWRS